jgi:hypothetical protein
VPTNKYSRWRASVEGLLASRWVRASMDVRDFAATDVRDFAATDLRDFAATDVRDLAATIVGMFDAGARDSEVAAFLSDQERAQEGAPWLTNDARLELVRDLHMSEGSVQSTQSNGEL